MLGTTRRWEGAHLDSETCCPRTRRDRSHRQAPHRMGSGVPMLSWQEWRTGRPLWTAWQLLQGLPVTPSGGPSGSTARTAAQGGQCSPENHLDTSPHNSTAHNSQRGSISGGRIHRTRSPRPWEHRSATKRGEAPTLVPRGWTLRTRHTVKEADTEGHTGCDSTDGKRAEQADPQTQRVGSWLSGAGGGKWGQGL